MYEEKDKQTTEGFLNQTIEPKCPMPSEPIFPWLRKDRPFFKLIIYRKRSMLINNITQQDVVACLYFEFYDMSFD